MTAKFRVTQTENMTATYQHMAIQILDKKYPSSKTSRYLEVIGEITFQMTTGDPLGYRWYGMTFKVSTDDPSHLARMAKVAKYIKDNRSSCDAQPEEIKMLLGSDEYFFHNSEFMPMSAIGQMFFKVMRGDEYYSSIVAPNVRIAQKELAKRKYSFSVELAADHVIAPYMAK